MKAEQIVPKSTKLKDLKAYIAELSSVVRDKSPRSADKLFSRLLSESVGDKASRVLEFIPCNIPFKPLEVNGQHFGFVAGGIYYTNARELLNWGWSMQQVVKCVDFTHYKVFKCETPYFIYGQLSTHTQLTTVSHSQRYADCDRGYWKPSEVNTITQEQWDKGIRKWRPDELLIMMKKHGVQRKEVYDRGVDMLQNRVFVIGGYTNNPNAWEHFIAQRTDKHTQKETRDFVEEFLLPNL